MSVSQRDINDTKQYQAERVSGLYQNDTKHDQNDTKQTLLHIRIPLKLKRKLKKLAEEEERSISAIIRIAIKRYLRERGYA